MTDKHPRTLADMTPDQRQQCAGMWAETPEGHLRIIHHYGNTLLGPGAHCITPTDETPETRSTSLYLLTPRFDLPRAWNPDGTPVDADPEEYTADTYGYVWPQKFEETGQPQGTRVRRWVSDWEVVE